MLDYIQQVEYNGYILLVEYIAKGDSFIMLKHGILGLLNYGDMSGYEIREVFKDSLNYFWSAQTSQIYREIGALEKNGWIKRQTVRQDGKPDKNICSITDEGQKELLRWLSEPDTDMDMRSPTLMKTFFMGELPISNSLNFFKKLNKEYRDLLNNLQAADHSIDSYQEMVPDKRKALFWQMTADFGKRYMQMYLDWSESCIQILENMEGVQQ